MVDVIRAEGGKKRRYEIILTFRGGETIPLSSIEVVTMAIGGRVFSTEEGNLKFNADKTGIVIEPGLIGLKTDEYHECHITVYDNATQPEGLPWARLIIDSVPWEPVGVPDDPD